ncbi:succinate dehydrogenase cytochrome b subunit [Desulfuromonas sp. TF]|uniref:succinate dehydrogenase cytochrome b subunit n=1 Tax=Desulfuromonas sp. TF TaxID=1232410 RepID=UPI00040B3C9C|nr:succinate dehydrogenase cytochrome b subunit [Desulfuromonas sp. TF]
MRWYKTSLGKKYIMGLTGLAMVGFVVAHMLGNLSIFGGAEGINSYAEHLRAFPPLLWAFRGAMLVFFILHIWMGITLYLENKSARPEQYAMKKNERTTFSAETMIWTGVILGVFVIYHLLHFTIHAFNPEFNQMADEIGRFDVFRMMTTSFDGLVVTVVYVAAMIVLLLHLRHGIQSFFQSLGLTNDATLPKLTTGGRWVAGLVAIGFLFTPILIFFNVIGG